MEARPSKFLVVGNGNITKALLAILDSLGENRAISVCDIKDGRSGEETIAGRSGEFDAVINLSSAPTGPLIDLCARHGLPYMDAAFEWIGSGQYPAERYAAELWNDLRPRPEIPVLHGFGMNPGLVEAITAIYAPGRPHLAVEFDYDTARARPDAPAVWGTWSPATFFEETYEVPGTVSVPGELFLPVPEALHHHLRVPTADGTFDFSAVVHDETAYMTLADANCRGAVFLYSAPAALKEYFSSHPGLSPAERAAVPVVHDLEGGETVGVAFYDGSENVRCVFNHADHARVFSRLGVNGTCWQTACGAYAGMKLLAAAKPGESLTVSAAMRTAPYREIVMDALERVGFSLESRDGLVTADAIRRTVLPLFGGRAGKEFAA
ncbi:MAG: hypothetical protein J6T01_04100 [Kiritimatiellae bacterium]|nr:hypothetical protein [Kiritimatiellia bacterium]